MHIPDSANIVGGLYVLGPPRSVIGRHALNALVYEVLGVLSEGGITPRASGDADATASYTGQLSAAVIAIANARFAALHPSAFDTRFGTAFLPALRDGVFSDTTTSNIIKAWAEEVFGTEFPSAFTDAFATAFSSAFASAFLPALRDGLFTDTTSVNIVKAWAAEVLTAEFATQYEAIELTGSFDCELRDSSGIVDTGTILYYKVGEKISLKIPNFNGTLSGSPGTTLRITAESNAAFPDPVKLTTGSFYQSGMMITDVTPNPFSAYISSGADYIEMEFGVFTPSTSVNVRGFTMNYWN